LPKDGINQTTNSLNRITGTTRHCHQLIQDTVLKMYLYKIQDTFFRILDAYRDISTSCTSTTQQCHQPLRRLGRINHPKSADKSFYCLTGGHPNGKRLKYR